jgi:hypothetical protein
MDLNASMLPASSMGESEAEVLAGKTPNQAPLCLVYRSRPARNVAAVLR